MEVLSEYLHFVDYLPTLIAFIALLFCWRKVGARWFLILFLTVGILDNYTAQYSINWTTHYYGWTILMNLLFFLPSFYRKNIAQKIYTATGSNFFMQAANLKFSQQEAAILFICFVSIVAHFISYIEILLYKNYVIDTPYFKLYLLDQLQVILHIFSSFAVLSFTFDQKKGSNYETTQA